MAGAAERDGALVVVPARGPAGVASRWLAVRPPRIARGLTLLALIAHAAVWGFDAPYGRSVAAGSALVLLGMTWMVWAWKTSASH